MSTKGWAITMGLGAVAGAVGVMMLSKSNPARMMVVKAANKVEDAAWQVSDKLSEKFDL